MGADHRMRIWALSLLAALALAGPAAAQSVNRQGDGAQFAAQVRTYLQAQAVKHIDDGFVADTRNADFVSALTLEDAVVWPVTLRRGAVYRVFAVCDNNCSDVDLDLYNADGAFVGRDVMANDKPYVEVTPTVDGVYYARIWLAACEAESCYVGGRVYRR